MRKIDLFQAKDGHWISNEYLLKKLIEVEAHKSEILFIHSDMSFGMPNLALKKSDMLHLVLETVMGLGVKTICFPTFTFSFCNGQNYDVKNSKSQMGALNEFVRKQPFAVRSIDPLMSVALIGEDKDLVTGIGYDSVGSKSTFDKLHSRKNVKFLFFGVSAGKCFTYTHYIEERLSVPYRYDRDFTGTIVDGDRQYTDTYKLFVRYKDVVPTRRNDFERFLVDNKMMKQVSCGDSSISSVDESIAYETLCEKIHRNINYMLDRPYPKILDKEFSVTNMVAL
ncbi:AAC(3) family N-acetyltransferase [Desulfosporosinus sp. FKA]|uniref:AAC(3) family N-acetyltransferase n=1 Tax=Desulfosporosinus sp. FKA TaxID=1969834 RepID=UPI000B49B89E|nr:AAC(3) family N-acetyltransferase [Desulfosporosinus sp. FKA]